MQSGSEVGNHVVLRAACLESRRLALALGGHIGGTPLAVFEKGQCLSDDNTTHNLADLVLQNK